MGAAERVAANLRAHRGLRFSAPIREPRADTLVIEDSRRGLLSAVGAGLPCLITVNGYTRGENFDWAVLVVSELGDPDRPPIEVLANRSAARPGDYVTLGDLQECIRSGGGRLGGSKTGKDKKGTQPEKEIYDDRSSPRSRPG